MKFTDIAKAQTAIIIILRIDMNITIIITFYFQVVDARAGPGTKSTLKIKNKLSPSMHKYKSPLKSKRSSQTFRSIPSPCPDELSGM